MRRIRTHSHGLGTSLIVTALALLPVPALADDAAASHDWPQFRGHGRDGVSAETGLLDAWPEGGPKEVWRRAIGEGYSGIAVVGDRLYTLYAEGEGEDAIEKAAAFETATGKEVWSTKIGPKIETEFGNGPRATPTVDGDRVYVLGSHGRLVALEAANGAERWSLEIKETFGAEQPHWGFSTSPLVEGDLLLVEAGGAEGKSYVGLDKADGEVRWASGEAKGGPGYNSPIAVDMGGKRRYVYVVGDKVRCIDPQGGLVWEHDWPRGETHAVPIFVPPNRLFVSGAQGVGAKLFEVVETGDEVKVNELWTSDFMRNHFHASVVRGDVLYGFDNATLKALSLADGELLWAKRGLGKGSLVLADGHIVVLSDRGKLVLVSANGEGYEEQGSVQALDGLSWTPPTLAGGRVYVRNHTEMVVYDLKDAS